MTSRHRRCVEVTVNDPSRTDSHSDAAERERRETGLDETIEQSFPASDPPSTDPNPDTSRRSPRQKPCDDTPHPKTASTSARPADDGRISRIDLARELEMLHHEPGWSGGQNAKTLVKYDDLRVVLVAVKPHARLPEHQTEGRAAVQTVAGHVQVRAQGRTFDLPMGRLLALDRGVPHDVEALEESAFLLTIAWPGRGEERTSYRFDSRR